MTLIDYGIVFAVFCSMSYYFLFINKGGLTTKENTILLAACVIPAIIIFNYVR